eukprot:TRINITY_DN23100_c0_g1_i1.p1 TRINITY_DN23100_c0_g1~~TRINITY_DN23100_c0_g1_i1.p1  ORF type:complete len:141 (+),score=50.26 TRINITY_DN23100_c0_g1_i1:104-526(+)
MMKFEKVDYSSANMQSYSVSLPPITDKAVEKAWKDHVLMLTTQLQAAHDQIAKLSRGGAGAAGTSAADKEAESYFAALDANRDGSLSATELHCGLSDLGFSEDEISGLIMKLDANKDGKISKQELGANFGVYRAFTKMNI